jgi:anti-sigma-K factor RskA
MSEPRDLSTDVFDGLVIAHHLGELDQEGQAVLAAELTRRGSEGREVARRLGRTLGEVALAAAPAEPPLALRARVLAAVPTSQPAPAPAPAAARSRRLWQAAAILGALLAAGLGLWAAQLADEGNRLRGEVERLDARAATADDAGAEIGTLLADLELAGAPGSVVYALTGRPALPQAGGRLFVDTIAGRAVLLASGLPRLESDQAFELWSIGGEGTRAVAMFRSDEDGRARRGIANLELLRDAQALAVTIEPASGAAQPSGEIVLSSSRF